LVPVGGQSLGATHATQAPLPSHTVPPLSVQALDTEFGFVPQAPAVHVFSRHVVGCCAQSEGVMQAMQLPLPSQTAPPASSWHDVPDCAGPIPQQPSVHVAAAHGESGAGQSVADAHVIPPSHVGPAPAPMVDDDCVDEAWLPPVPVWLELVTVAEELPPLLNSVVLLPLLPQPSAPAAIARAARAEANKMFVVLGIGSLLARRARAGRNRLSIAVMGQARGRWGTGDS